MVFGGDVAVMGVARERKMRRGVMALRSMVGDLMCWLLGETWRLVVCLCVRWFALLTMTIAVEEKDERILARMKSLLQNIHLRGPQQDPLWATPVGINPAKYKC